jgi:hypothetical protein
MPPKKEPRKMAKSTPLHFISTPRSRNLMVPSPTDGNPAQSYNSSTDLSFSNDINKTRKISHDFSHQGAPLLPFRRFEGNFTRGSDCCDNKIDGTRLTLAMIASQNSRLQFFCATQTITRKRAVSVESSCDDITPLAFTSPAHRVHVT